MDIFHVRGGEHAVLLSGEVDEEGEGGDVARGAVCHAHLEWLFEGTGDGDYDWVLEDFM